MSTSVFRLFLCVPCLLIISFASGQTNNFTDSYSIEFKKNAAIGSAKSYLESRFSDKRIAQYFIADSTSSYIVCDNYITYFSSASAYCPPVGFKITFNVALKAEGFSSVLQSHLILPVDSFFTILADSLEEVWRHGYFDAWENVISNKYKFNFSNVLDFARENNLKDYEVEFSVEKKSKHSFRFYWFVTEGAIRYRIDPKSGAVRKRRLMPIKAPGEIS